jgi:hypothetical protein
MINLERGGGGFVVQLAIPFSMVSRFQNLNILYFHFISACGVCVDLCIQNGQIYRWLRDTNVD